MILAPTFCTPQVWRLISLQVRTARVVRGDRELDVPVERVALGDVVRARPVEKVPSRPRQQRRPAHDVGAIVRLV